MICRCTVLLSIFLSIFVVTACGISNPDNEQKFISPASSVCKKAAIEDQFLVRWMDGSRTREYAPSEEDFIKNFLEKHKEEIRYAEHDYVITLDPVTETDAQTLAVDPEDWGQNDIEAPWAWQNGMDGKDVLIAVVDSGADVSHPQLAAQLYKNPRDVLDGFDNDQNGYVDDVTGWDFVHNSRDMMGDTYHGTHVSGIALADHAAGVMKGIAPKAKLLPLKFIDGDSGVLSKAIEAIDYAVGIAKREDKPLVINASWGGSACSMDLLNKMDEFNSRRVLFAVAAGNNGRDLSTFPIYPATFGLDSEIVVGAYAALNVLAKFSNFGPRVHLAAPGYDIFSIVPKGYGREHGTSMATPFVAGAAALLWGLKPTATTAQIRQAIFDSVETGPFNVKLHGKLNLRKAKLALDNM